jgi:structural toxin protein (hemagglutinin/hemolysin) RtxA
MYMLIFNVPASHLDKVKSAIFDAGAGKVDNYSHCSWEVLGEGQFKPLSGSNPFIGIIDQLETVAEYQVETLCEAEYIREVITALKTAHPYEVPSYQVLRLEDF